jgi:hypothetical protein
MRVRAFDALRILVISCIFVGAVSANTSKDCDLIPRNYLSTELDRGTRIFVLGEIHGSREIPLAVQAFVCESLRAGKSISVLFEQPSNENSDFQTFFNNKMSAKQYFAKSKHWLRNEDGRGSVEMWRFIEWLKKTSLRNENTRRISVYGVSGHNPKVPRDSNIQGMAEASIAMNIAEVVKSDQSDLFFILIGDWHARRAPKNEINRSAMDLLALTYPNSINVLFRFDGGNTWSCSEVKCGVTQLRTTKFQGKKFSLDRQKAGSIYDFVFPLSMATASPPLSEIDVRE